MTLWTMTFFNMASLIPKKKKKKKKKRPGETENIKPIIKKKKKKKKIKVWCGYICVRYIFIIDHILMRFGAFLIRLK